MPRKKYYGRKKRTYRRRRGYRPARYPANRKTRSKIISIWKRQVRSKDPVPLERYCVFKYIDNVFWTTVGGADDNIYRGNSLYDPDYTGAGAQPLGFDQLCTLYSRFIVFGSAIKVTIVNMDTVPVLVNLAKSYLPTSFTNAVTAAERCDSKTRYIGPAGSNRDTVVLKSFAKTGTVLGYKDVEDEDGLAHSSSTNPSQQWFWHVGVENDDAGNLSVNMVVELKYYVLMTNKTHLARS